MTDADPMAALLADLEYRQRRERARLVARSPKPAGRVVADVVRLRGYDRVRSQRALDGAWQQIVTELLGVPTVAALSRAGRVRRGVLEVWAGNSAVNQELVFHKRVILGRLRELAPDQGVRDFRVRVGNVQQMLGEEHD